MVVIFVVVMVPLIFVTFKLLKKLLKEADERFDAELREKTSKQQEHHTKMVQTQRELENQQHQETENTSRARFLAEQSKLFLKMGETRKSVERLEVSPETKNRFEELVEKTRLLEQPLSGKEPCDWVSLYERLCGAIKSLENIKMMADAEVDAKKQMQ